MADEADLTAERDEREAPARLAASRRDEGPAPNGSCHWCGDSVGPGLRYCDTDCRDDHHREMRGKGMRGTQRA